MRSGRKSARGGGRTKEWNAKDDQIGVTPPRQRKPYTSRMPELGPYGSVRGARGNSRPYRDRHVLMLSSSDFGTFETCSDVGSSVAIGGKADISRTSRFGSD